MVVHSNQPVIDNANHRGRKAGYRDHLFNQDRTCKVCSICGDMKPLVEYPLQPKGLGGRMAQCCACRSARQSRRYAAMAAAWKKAGCPTP
jgi:hypothetical protein